MDSVVGEDQTLPIDLNGSTNMSRLPDSSTVGGRGVAMETVTASVYPGQKMSPVKPLTMKDYEHQITGLKKENFNLKLRIYFMEERMQQKFDDSAEDIFKTNIELKVELESMKRDLAEKQELLVSASEALESLAGKESGEAHRVKQQAQREMDQLKDYFNTRIQQLEESLKAAEDEAEKMAAIAEQEKVRNIDMEKQLLAFGLSSTFKPSPAQDQHQALQEKDSIIEQLRLSLKNQESVIEQLRRTSNDQGTGATPASEHVSQLSALLSQKDGELQALRETLEHERARTEREKQSLADRQNEVTRLEATSTQLDEDLRSTKGTVQNLTKTLEDKDSQNKILSGKLEEMEREMASEKKNALKRDKTIQGLTLVLKGKEKEIEELCHEIEGRDQALAKAREAAHKAQIQKFQGAEEQQNLLIEKQTELAHLQLEHHTKALEAQKLQRTLGRREQELGELQQAKEQLEQELEDLQQQKKKGDKAINDLNNQLKKLNGEIGERENALEQQYQALLDESKRKLRGHEVTIQRLTASLSEKELQLQEYMNLLNEQQNSRSPGGGDSMLAKLRERLKEKEKALERAMDEKFAAIEEKDEEIRRLRLSLREKEREVERLNNLLSHSKETIDSLDSLVKEKDAALQHQAGAFDNLQRAKRELEEQLARSLREKDSIIAQLQRSLQAKAEDMEEMSNALLSQSQSGSRDLAERLGQRLKVAEAMLAEALRDKERLVADNESAVDGLLATISSKDQLFKESAEHYNRTLSERTQEIQELKRQLSQKQQQLASAERQSLETAALKAQLTEKDAQVNELVEGGQERGRCLAEVRLAEAEAPLVLELRQTVQVLQERLEEKEAELSKNDDEGNVGKTAASKKTAVMLKKELEQKTEALNKALKKENELRIELADLRSLLADLENRNEAQAANIESLTSTLETKDSIIWDLHERLSKQDKQRDSQTHSSQPPEEGPRPGLPQRERTIIGGDSQQEILPSPAALLAEYEELIRAVKAEQQLYTSLVRTVKEQDGAQRLHALQMELAAVQLLRQKLEEGVRTNEDLRQDLEREIQRAKQREGRVTQESVDLSELESMRHQLEDAQRWNASLQARLGAIQSRGGGVGGTNDSADTLSFIADQTSYMSICVGDGLDELGLLSVAELRQKLVELQDYVNELQALNAELQRSASLTESSAHNLAEKDKEDVTKLLTQEHCQRKLEEDVPANEAHLSLNGVESQSAARAQVVGERVDGSSPLSDSERCEGALLDVTSSSTASTSHTPSGGSRLKCAKKSKHEWSQEEQGKEMALLHSLLMDSGVSSVTQLREEVQRLRAENVDLKGLLKEEKSTESKESADSSGESDGNKDLRREVEKLKSEAKGYRKVIKLLKEQLELNSACEGETGFNPELIVSMAREIERLKAELEACRRRAESLESKMLEMKAQAMVIEQAQGSCFEKDSSPRKNQGPDLVKHSNCARSRLPVPIRPNKQLGISRKAGGQAYERDSQSLRDESHLMGERQLLGHGLPRLLDLDEHGQVGVAQQSAPWSDSEQAAVERSSDFDQLEPLHSERQEKERAMAQLEEQAAACEELRAQLRQKERLSRELGEALQAAESTIAYLTACNLDGQVRDRPDSDAQLHDALREKEAQNQRLLERLGASESALAALGVFSADDAVPAAGSDPRELARGLEDGHRQTGWPPLNAERAEAAPPGLGERTLQRQVDQLQAELWEQSRQNAELQERLRSAHNQDSSPEPRKGPETTGKEPKEGHETASGRKKDTKGAKPPRQPGEVREDPRAQEQLVEWLVAYLQAAECCIASLSAYCTDDEARNGQGPLADLEQKLEMLRKAGRERDRLHERYSGVSSQAGVKSPGQQDTTKTLLDDVGRIQKACEESRQAMAELQRALEEQKLLARQHEDRLRTADSSAPGRADACEHLDALQKALKEKKRSCKVLEEKLAAAHAIIARHNSARKTRSSYQQTTSLERDDKEVQVDLQDLGYETSGKSENDVDREENSSTDNDLGLRLHPSESNISSLLKPAHGAFSSTENLDSNSSASYPSSPALSSPKAGPQGPQAYEDYGRTDSVDLLKRQVSELKAQLENRQRVIRHLQGLLRQDSLSSDLLTVTSDPGHSSSAGKHDSGLGDGPEHASGALGSELTRGFPPGHEEEDMRAMKDQVAALDVELEKERSLNRNLAEQLQQVQLRSRSASPARMDSLVQSQARELSQLRQQIKESRGLGALQRQQLEDLNKAFEELLQASDVDYYMGEVFREQLDKSLTLIEQLEDRLENGDAHSDNEDSAMLELAQRESLCLSVDSPCSLRQEIGYLRSQLEGDRGQLQKQLRYLVQQNQNLAEATKEQLDLLSKELQDKNRMVQSLRKQLRGQSPSSLHCSDSEVSDRTPHSDGASTYDISPTSSHGLEYGHGFRGVEAIHDFAALDHASGAAPGRSASPGSRRDSRATCPEDAGTEQRPQDLRRENSRLLDQLRSSEQLIETLRSELDLHCSLLGGGGDEQPAGPAPAEPHRTAPRERAQGPAAAGLSPGLLAEHLQEIRALRRRLEETIRTNDRLREQLERRLADVEKDPATNIFIHGTEDQGQLANELRFLWGQNQALKEQLSLGSRDKQKENEKLRESLARRTAKLEYVRNELEALKKENGRLQSRVTAALEDNRRLQDSLRYGREESHRLQSEINVQRQQLMDNHQLLQSLRVELQVYEQIKVDADKPAAPAPTQSTPDPGSGPADLSELLSEIRHLRLQLERSIHTNNALRQRLEEQLRTGPAKQEGSPSILINYLLSGEARAPAGDEGTKRPGQDGCDPCHLPPQGSARDRDPSAVLHEMDRQTGGDMDGLSQYSGSSVDSASPAPSRLVPGHRLWANKNGRHILGLIEDYNALRKQISEGRKLTHGMDRHLQQCFRSLAQQDSKSQVVDQQLLKGFSTNINRMQQVLEEAGRLLKLVWRVSLPSGLSADGTQSHQDELLKSEVMRLKTKLSQQEKLLMGAVNRLRSTNQLKEGMEKVIIDQLSLTHGVLRKARGNLETNFLSRFGPKGLPGTTEGTSQWIVIPVDEGAPIKSMSTRSWV